MKKNGLISVIFLLFAFFCYSQKNISFKHLTNENGLASNQVNAILKDSSGFVWFGTSRGLSRYDGHRFKNYSSATKQENSLLHNSVQELFIGFEHQVWVKTSNGTCIYNERSDSFIRNVDSVLLERGFPAGKVKKIVVKQHVTYLLYDSGNLYFETIDGKIGRLFENEELAFDGKVTDIILDKELLVLVTSKGEILAVNALNLSVVWRKSFSFERLIENPEFRLFLDSELGCWVYAKNFPFGALRYTSNQEEIPWRFERSGTYSVSNDYISNIQQLGTSVWLATDHGGINLFDLVSNRIDYIMHDQFDKSSLRYNSTTALYKDNDEIMWVGTYKGGASYFHEQLNYFTLVQHQGDDEHSSLPYNDINCFIEDKNGIIWIGTNGGGLVRYDAKKERYESFLHDSKDPNSIGSNVVVSLHVDRDGQLWVGTYHGGLNQFVDGKFKRFLHNAKDSLSVNDNNVWSILHDSQDRFWVGMLTEGIDLMDRDNKKFHRFDLGSLISFYSAYTAKVIEDKKQNIWIGTSNGVVRLSSDGSTTIFDEKTYPSTLSNNLVSDLLEDTDGNIWVATQVGVSIIKDDKVTYLSSNEGLIDNVVVGLVMDDFGDVWATTPKGISRIHYSRTLNAYSVYSYDKSDGLQLSNFNERSSYKLSDGRLIFGGSDGFNSYRPQRLQFRQWSPVSVVDFQISDYSNGQVNHSALIDEWRKNYATKKVVRVPYNIRGVSVLLSDFDFVRSYRSKLQYKFSGIADEWIDLDQMLISLSDLRAGSYTISLRGVDETGQYSAPVTLLEVVMEVPWWRSNSSYFVYFICMVCLLLLFRRLEQMRAKTRFNLMQAEQQVRHMNEMKNLKEQFFTSVSHEFRTPISLIMSPVKKLKKEENNHHKKHYLDIIERNALSLLGLVNQLLDLKKSESKGLEVHLTRGDVVVFLRKIGDQFVDMAQVKSIDYQTEIYGESQDVYLDFEKLERLLLNLLSNAFKFTRGGGRIRLIVRLDNKRIQLKITDSGIGICQSDLPHLFEPYYQAKCRPVWGDSGSGLGLAIVKDYVDIMQGHISIESQENIGTTVVVELPLCVMDVSEALGSERALFIAEKLRRKEGGIAKESALKILLVEDNTDYAFYLKDNLEAYFQVHTFPSAEQAWHQISSLRPDVVVSDLHLPGRSGIELCKDVRENSRTKHIPFILITAVGAEAQQLEAISAGANDFMTKPFNFEIFLSKIKRLIEQQDLVAERYKRQVDLSVSQAVVENQDERFVSILAGVIEKHLQDDALSVEMLASNMGMTRVGLYKKVLSITGFTPIEYIRNIRLSKALDLLKNSKLTISEISYEVGFGAPKQFSKYFKAFYGETPSSFRQ